MSEILSFIFENFGNLRPGDYGLLIVFALGVFGGLHLVFRWLYSARYEAQRDLIELKDQTVTSLKSQLDLTHQDRDDLREQLRTKVELLSNLEKIGTATEVELRQAREGVLLISVSHLMILLQRESICYRYLFIYSILLKEAPPKEAVKLTSEFSTRVESIYEQFLKCRENTPMDLHLTIKLLRSKETEELMNEVRDMLDHLGVLIDAKIAKLEKTNSD